METAEFAVCGEHGAPLKWHAVVGADVVGFRCTDGCEIARDEIEGHVDDGFAVCGDDGYVRVYNDTPETREAFSEAFGVRVTSSLVLPF